MYWMASTTSGKDFEARPYRSVETLPSQTLPGTVRSHDLALNNGAVYASNQDSGDYGRGTSALGTDCLC